MSNRLIDKARPYLRPFALRAVVAGGTIGAGQLAMPSSPGGYQDLRRAPFAPPTWAFPPAWTLIELALADSVVRVAEAPASDSRRLALGAAAANDALYALFPIAFFRLRSPLLTAAVTLGQFGVAGVQTAATRQVDARAARDIYPQLAWLTLAGAAAVAQALANPDPLFGTKALAPGLGRASGD